MLQGRESPSYTSFKVVWRAIESCYVFRTRIGSRSWPAPSDREGEHPTSRGLRTSQSRSLTALLSVGDHPESRTVDCVASTSRAIYGCLLEDSSRIGDGWDTSASKARKIRVSLLTDENVGWRSTWANPRPCSDFVKTGKITISFSKPHGLIQLQLSTEFPECLQRSQECNHYHIELYSWSG